jgi:hypothetical protein
MHQSKTRFRCYWRSLNDKIAIATLIDPSHAQKKACTYPSPWLRNSPSILCHSHVIESLLPWKLNCGVSGALPSSVCMSIRNVTLRQESNSRNPLPVFSSSLMSSDHQAVALGKPDKCALFRHAQPTFDVHNQQKLGSSLVFHAPETFVLGSAFPTFLSRSMPTFYFHLPFRQCGL